MRILVQIHTWNDADVIGSVIDAILRQTRAVEEILIVDNGSTDGTAELAYPAIVTVVRHALNLGTSGSVKTAIEYARARGYDWLWVLDADSMPRPDALQLLAGVIETGDPDLTQEIGVVCSSHNLVKLGRVLHRCLSPYPSTVFPTTPVTQTLSYPQTLLRHHCEDVRNVMAVQLVKFNRRRRRRVAP